MTEDKQSTARTHDAVNKEERAGLGILYATPDAKDDMSNVEKRDLTAELRERYWIKLGKDAGIGKASWGTVSANFEWKIERNELGRSRNEPGDGFRYAVWAGSNGIGTRAEWFEVTEVFEGVEARDVEAFMRLQNGMDSQQGFDSEAFLNALNLGAPGRAAQRRAADGVMNAVAKKMTKESYRDMTRTHGYGTLIVGVPLWFANFPAIPLRAKNAIDDFMTRISIGLESHVRRLRGWQCPFWRIVVVWETSARSMREWASTARFDLYDDPAVQTLSAVQPMIGSWARSLVELKPDSMAMHVTRVRPEKRERHVRLPQRIVPVPERLDELKRRNRLRIHKRIRSRILQWLLGLTCFVRTYGLAGLERWIVARISVRHWVASLALKRRTKRLYRASLLTSRERRQARGTRCVPFRARQSRGPAP